MPSCPVCGSRLSTESIGSEFACPACGARLRGNPIAASLIALFLGVIPGGILISVDHGWPWFVSGLATSMAVTYAFWRAFFRIELTSHSKNAAPGSPKARSPRKPWHLWVIGVIALLWSAVGAMDYLMTQTRNEAYMRGFTPDQLAFVYALPPWVVAAWAVGVWGGVLGALLLLFRRHIAVWIFLASLLAIEVTAFHNYLLSDGLQVMGDAFSLGLAALIFLVALGLFLYARTMQKRGVLA